MKRIVKNILPRRKISGEKTRRSFLFKVITVFVLLNLLFQVFYPTVAFALTGGPSQPEMQGFEPIGTTNMVDLSSGSFTYNIPLMDVEGYPINLAYHSGVTMDAEASWVGLGWSINPGEINRQMRGLPDDFNGDQVTQNFNIKDNITAGIDADPGLKIVGFPIPLNLGTVGCFYNNYTGVGIDASLSTSLSAGSPNKGSLTLGLGLDFNSSSGLDVAPSLGFGDVFNKEDNNTYSPSINVGTAYNSRSGIKGISMGQDLAIRGFDAAFSTVAPTYIPKIEMPLNNFSVSLSATLGAAIFAIHPNATITGHFTDESLAASSVSLSSYGYMYADQAKGNPYALHDFNREKDVAFLPHIANLPITNFTYDLFSINGQGVSGQFRPFRGDVGILYDHIGYNQSTSLNIGVELGVGDLAHNGVYIGPTTSNTVVGPWTGDNNFNSTVSFQSLQPGNINYEPFYIKSTGEKTINDQTYYNKIGDTYAATVQLNRSGSTVTALNSLEWFGNYHYVPSNLTKTQRERRDQSTSILSAQEATYFALDKTINSYPYNKNVYGSCTAADSITRYPRLTWPQGHMSEVTVTNPDGRRYVYGIPAYNTLQDEATFAVNGKTVLDPTSSTTYYVNDSTNLVGYTAGSDNSTSNSENEDHYFNEQILPPYSHSFLLSGILSPDYRDLTGDGITDDDLGQAIKFNYTKVYGGSIPYRWRVPFESDEATFQAGCMSSTLDDRGNYIYGEKEVWYVHSIESKTMVAQFILEPRADAFGVTGKNGGIDNTRPLQCLKEINLYSKADLIKYGSQAVPIKTVHFVYDYLLCQGIPNTTNTTTGHSGKLTLTQVYFTYGNNTEGSLNSYYFYYKGLNPNYSHNQYDRWGYYKYNHPGLPTTQDFMYTLQDSARTDTFATAWNLTDIDLPSGGHITAKYESNDYAYVQNQRANQMFIIQGVGSTSSSTPGNKMYDYTSLISPLNITFSDWIFVHLPTHVVSTQDFYNKYLAGVDSTSPGGTSLSKLYFRFLVNVGNISQPYYEYVPGYADIQNWQEINDSTGAIQLTEPQSGNLWLGKVNPVVLAAWQYLRLNLPQYAYAGSNPNTAGSVLSVMEDIVGIIPDIMNLIFGYPKEASFRKLGKYIVPSYSYIRLDNPNFKKYGGGARVKEIDMSDNWSDMVNGQSSFLYGQKFNYTKTAPNGQVISSGVATYEPLIGGDENPCRQPLPYEQKYILAPTNRFYTETPLGESLYPAPGVVYSQVTVSDLKYPGVNRTATGKTVSQFYTAYDFPVITQNTDLDVERVKPSILSSIFNIGVTDHTTASQGFSVEVNDMPGKAKKEQVYDKNGALISEVDYTYNVDNLGNLNNNVQVIEPNGSITTASVGKDIDVWEDMREEDTQTTGIGVTLNNESFIFPAGIIPLFLDIFVALPSYSSEDTRFRSAVTTKYIHRTGLLSSVTKIQNGSKATTQNLLYDGETGDVVLTKTNNEFNAPVYSFTYPAHWAYDGMGLAYENIGAELYVSSNSAGKITSPSSLSIPTYFSPGDEIEYKNSSGLSDTLAWVTEPEPGDWIIMNANGSPININNRLVKVIRSGRRNMAETPVGTVVSMVSPINTAGTGITTLQPSSQILQASGTMFNDLWKIPNNKIMKEKCVKVTGPSWACVIKFLDSITMNHQLYAGASDSITLGKYVSTCGTYSKYLYYSLGGEIGMDYAKSFQFQLGNCTYTLSAASENYGVPGHMGYIYLDSLTLYHGDAHTYDTSSGCLTVYSTQVHYNPEFNIGTICSSCMNCYDTCQNVKVDSIFNPYAVGMLGNWRPQRNYIYYDTRSPALASTTTNIWSTGIFRHFDPIWDVPITGNIWAFDTTDKNWTWSSQATMYDQKGNGIENEDALGRYSSTLFGYHLSYPVAQAANAKYKDIAFDGFEDYGFNNTCTNPCDSGHFDFRSVLYPGSVDTTSAQAHTGRYSLMITAGDSAVAGRAIHYYNGNLDSISSTYQYLLLNGGTIPLFSPDSGLYILSAWVKENTSCGVTGYTKDSIVVEYQGSTSKTIMKPSGPVIEGWQRFESRFKIPKTATAIKVKLVAGTNTAYYDDIRMEPFASEMTTYVYASTGQGVKPVAILDENNYATFYEYNDEGILMRVKKETERGIMTIKESRSSYQRN